MENQRVDIILHGFGRMGLALSGVAGVSERVDIKGVLALNDTPEHEGAPVLPQVPRPRSPRSVVVDFSRPAGLRSLLGALAGSGYPLVSGTTGIGGEERELLEAYSKESAVFYDENMSYGISVVKRLLREAGGLVGPTADVEIVEFHHRNKADFPSGTALALGRAVRPDGENISGRGSYAGPERSRTHIHSVRAGAIPGEHQVHFALSGEVITLSHRALSRDVFARGALRAAEFVADREAGFFTMDDLMENASHA